MPHSPASTARTHLHDAPGPPLFIFRRQPYPGLDFCSRFVLQCSHGRSGRIDAGGKGDGHSHGRHHEHQGHSQAEDRRALVGRRAERAKLGNLRYIWLRRKNKVAQAISYHRAGRTGVWQAVKGRGDQANVIDQTLEFDFDEIDRTVRLVERFDWQWEEYFRSHRLTPLMLVYEEFVKTYDPTVRGVLKYLGLPYEDAKVAAPALEKQSDVRAAEWEDRTVSSRDTLRDCLER
jgi:LPS sulfotransferase NodH